MEAYTFPKHIRLKSHKSIGDLFSNSNAYGRVPLRILWKLVDDPHDEGSFKLVIAVPKRKLKRAVDRNKVKRLIRESFRQNKNKLDSFLKEKNVNCHLAILYTSTSIASFNTINETMKLLLDKYQDEYEKYAE